MGDDAGVSTARAVDDEVDGPTSIFAPELRATSGGLITLITMIAFEAMAVTPALPTAARELHGLGAFGWAFTAFLVANVLGMVAAGQLSDEHGPRLPLLTGMALFVAGLTVAGTATSMAQLIAARGVQGLGGGMLITAAYVVIGRRYAEQLRPKVFAATSAAWLLPSLVGPVISGALTQHLSWRWVFLGLLPFVLAGCALLLPVLPTLAGTPAAGPAGPSAAVIAAPPGGGRTADRRRVLRAVLVAGGVATLEAAGQHPSAPALVGAVAGAGALAWGLRGLLPAGTFAVRPGVGAPIALRGLLAGAFFGTEAVVPLLLSVQHGLGATLAGLPLACSGITWALGSWWQGRSRPGHRPDRPARLLRTGFGCVAGGVALIAATVPAASPAWLAFPAWLLAGFGCGLAMPTSSVLLLKHTTDADRGADSAALQLADTTTAALTTGVAGVLVAAAARGALGYGVGFVAQAAAMAALAVFGAVLSGRARTAPG